MQQNINILVHESAPHRFSSPVWETNGEKLWLLAFLASLKCKPFPAKKEKQAKIEVFLPYLTIGDYLVSMSVNVLIIWK